MKTSISQRCHHYQIRSSRREGLENMLDVTQTSYSHVTQIISPTYKYTKSPNSSTLPPICNLVTNMETISTKGSADSSIVRNQQAMSHNGFVWKAMYKRRMLLAAQITHGREFRSPQSCIIKVNQRKASGSLQY